VDGIYNESAVSATFDEGTNVTLLDKPKFVLLADAIFSIKLIIKGWLLVLV
jgi:hypothetical protein